MPERLFLFVQLEFPWELGPPDGRYLLRSPDDGEPERVIVLETLGAPKRHEMARAGRRAGFGRAAQTGDGAVEPAPVATSRVTIVDPVALSAERQARAWLDGLDAERESDRALAVLNRVLYFHRIACADPYVREVSVDQALVIRAGWGEGEELIGGNGLFARELSWRGRRRRGPGRWPGGRRYSAALRPAERLAQLLGARGAPLVCEESALRARLDLDHSRPLHAALELDAAYETALAELGAEEREDLAVRLAELQDLRAGVAGQAQAARAGASGSVDEEVVLHALQRLEAALRARTVGGLG